jgi:hypothetical protein
MTCALYIRVSRFFRKRKCRRKGHDWIATTNFNPPPKFEDGALALKFNMLLLLACCMGLPEFALLGTGMTDVERLCARCGKYEKGVLWGEATMAEASTKQLKNLESR